MLEVAGPSVQRGSSWARRSAAPSSALPEDTRLNKHIAVFGASGTMKSRASSGRLCSRASGAASR